jgi:hypothetical protein
MVAVAACLGLARTADKAPPKTFLSFADSRTRGGYDTPPKKGG